MKKKEREQPKKVKEKINKSIKKKEKNIVKNNKFDLLITINYM